MTEEEALKEWDTIYALFKHYDAEPRFFYNDIRAWDKVSFNDEYALFYFEFDLESCKDKFLLARISSTVSCFKMTNYTMSISKKDYFNNEYWRLVITLRRTAEAYPIF